MEHSSMVIANVNSAIRCCQNLYAVGKKKKKVVYSQELKHSSNIRWRVSATTQSVSHQLTAEVLLAQPATKASVPLELTAQHSPMVLGTPPRKVIVHEIIWYAPSTDSSVTVLQPLQVLDPVAVLEDGDPDGPPPLPMFHFFSLCEISPTSGRNLMSCLGDSSLHHNHHHHY